MNDPRLRARYGLKYDPFAPNIPPSDLWNAPGFERFAVRVEHLTREGGIAMISGPVGGGKSKALQSLSVRLAAVPDLVVGVMERPQSATGDFYRELGRLFGVDLSPANRYGGFRALRERWEGHIQSCLRHPVLLVDEAQEMPTACLSELRLLGSVASPIPSASRCGWPTAPCGRCTMAAASRCTRSATPTFPTGARR